MNCENTINSVDELGFSNYNKEVDWEISIFNTVELYIEMSATLLYTDFPIFTICYKYIERERRDYLRPSYTKFETLMDDRGVRPVDVTNALGFKTQSVFSDWKSGKSYPKTDKLVLIARFFGTTVEALMED